MYVCTCVCVSVCMYVCVDGWMDGWMDVFTEKLQAAAVSKLHCSACALLQQSCAVHGVCQGCQTVAVTVGSRKASAQGLRDEPVTRRMWRNHVGRGSTMLYFNTPS